MTCVVSWIENEKIYMSSDSAAAGGYDLIVYDNPKVFIKRDMIFGYTDSFRMGQLLQYSLTIPKHPKGQDDMEYMCTSFIDAVSKLLLDKRLAILENNELRIFPFLVGYKQNVYRVDPDLHVGKQIKLLNFWSIGAGSEYAMGAFYALKEHNVDPLVRIRIALEAAGSFTQSVSGPYKTLILET